MDGAGKLAGFADGDEAGGEGLGDGGAEDVVPLGAACDAVDAGAQLAASPAAARTLLVGPGEALARPSAAAAIAEAGDRVLIRRGSPCVATEAGESLHRHAQQLQLLEAQALAPFGLHHALVPSAARAGAAGRPAPLPLSMAVTKASATRSADMSGFRS